MITDDGLPLSKRSERAESNVAPQCLESLGCSEHPSSIAGAILSGEPDSDTTQYDAHKATSSRTSIKDLEQVTTSDGQIVQCTYKQHPAYDDSNSLYLTFHFIFVLYTASRLGNVARSMRLAISTLFDFVVLHNNSNPSWIISTFIDITPIIFENFRKWLDSQSITQGRAYFIRQATKIISETYEDIPNLNLPLVSYSLGGKTEPLSEELDCMFQSTCGKVVDRLRIMIDFREVVAHTIPYTQEELQVIANPKPSRIQLLTWYKWYNDNKYPLSHARLADMVARCQDDEISLHHTSSTLRKTLNELLLSCDIEIPLGYDGDITYMYNRERFKLEAPRVISTFLSFGYPLKLTISELSNNYALRTITKIEHCDDVIKTLIYLIMCKKVESDEGWLSVEGYLHLYFPFGEDVAALALLIMRKTGWNRESVLAIDPDNFYHHYSEIFKSNVKIIFSEKLRSQSLDTEYETGKTVFAVTEPGDRYSAEQLFLLAKKLSEPFLTMSNELDKLIHSRATKPIFYYMISWMAWTKAGQFNCLDHSLRFSDCVRRFLAENELLDNDIRLTTSKELTPRLRSTWLQDENLSAPIEWLSTLMGHESRNTTDTFYDSSERANEARKKRLRGVLEMLLTRLRQRQFKGLIGQSADEIASARLEIFHIPGFDRALWGCANSQRPDWPGAPELKGDNRCRALDKCMFCSQCSLLVDSLPFLMERMQQLESTNECDYDDDDPNSPTELKIIGSILADWGDASDIAKAATYLRKNRPLLPLQISDLIGVIDITLEQ